MRRDEIPKDLCREILDLDKSIRFAGIADKFGKTLMYKYRKQATPLLSKEEAALSIIQASIRMGSLKTMLGKLGRIVYAFAMYEKVKRATIPIGSNFVLLVSFEINTDHEPIILEKIIPLLQKHGLRNNS